MTDDQDKPVQPVSGTVMPRYAGPSTFARLPEPHESEAAASFIETRTRSSGEESAWKDLCHTLINVKEFIFVN